MELHAALTRLERTTLRLVRDAAQGTFDVRLSREWDPALSWSGYARTFQVDQVPCATPLVHADREARALLAEVGAP